MNMGIVASQEVFFFLGRCKKEQMYRNQVNRICCRWVEIIFFFSILVASSLHQPNHPFNHTVYKIPPYQTLYPLLGHVLHAIKRSRHATVHGAHGVGVVAQIHRLQRPLAEVVGGEKGPQRGVERVDHVTGTLDIVRVDGGEGREIAVLGELETEFGRSEGIACQRLGQFFFGFGGRRGIDESEDVGVDLAGFGVGGVGVGEDGGMSGVS